ncbi:MAG: N-acetylmuramoyl-L-alanine amidase [Clostridiales bacterium]|nr:N-acetylmuramoyl-L-alanine amidase [Clostridiales bacterium]
MKNPKASLTAEFEDAYGSQSSAVTNESRPRSNAKKAKKKRSGDSFWTRMLIFVCGALVGLGVFAGVMYFTKGKDAEAKREKRRSSSSYRTSSSNRSSSGSRGDFYRPKDDEEEENTSSGGRGRISRDDDFDDFDDYDDYDDYDDGKQDDSGFNDPGYTLPKDISSDDLSGYTIILDPGHGGRDTGCVFPFDNPQYNECDFNLRIAKRVEQELTSRGATVHMLRTDNSWVSLYNRLAQVHLICVDIAQEQGILPFPEERADELRDLLWQSIYINEDTVASGGMGIMVGSGVGEDLNELFEMEYKLEKVLFLSIHLNSSETRTLHGNQIFYVTDDSIIESERRQMTENSEFQRSDFPIREEYYGRHNEDNFLLGCCLYDNIVGNIPAFETNGTPVKADNYAVLREHGLTGALIEVAYLSDDNDREMLQQDQVVDQIAYSISDGVKMYFIQKDI